MSKKIRLNGYGEFEEVNRELAEWKDLPIEEKIEVLVKRFNKLINVLIEERK